jgi:hypothetical protein
VLANLRPCCHSSHRKWEDLELVERLDAISGIPVVTDLFAHHLESDRLPKLASASRVLRLLPIGEQTPLLADEPAAAALRAASG